MKLLISIFLKCLCSLVIPIHLIIPLLLFSVNLPVEIPDDPNYKSHDQFPLLRPVKVQGFGNVLFLSGEEFLPSLQGQGSYSVCFL